MLRCKRFVQFYLHTQLLTYVWHSNACMGACCLSDCVLLGLIICVQRTWMHLITVMVLKTMCVCSVCLVIICHHHYCCGDHPSCMWWCFVLFCDHFHCCGDGGIILPVCVDLSGGMLSGGDWEFKERESQGQDVRFGHKQEENRSLYILSPFLFDFFQKIRMQVLVTCGRKNRFLATFVLCLDISF